MLFSIAIPTRNRPDSVCRLLASLSAQSRLPDDILVVDSSTDRRTQECVERCNGNLRGRIRFFTNEPGLTRQRNRALRENTSDLLVFLDDDVVVAPDFLAVLARAFADNPDLVGIGAFIENQYGRSPDKSWKILSYLGLMSGEYSEGRVLPYGICLPLTTLQPFTGLKPTGWLAGGATAWRAGIFEQFRFNESLAGYGVAEDKEFSVRVGRSHRLAISGDARLTHLHQAGGRPDHFQLGRDIVQNSLLVLHVACPGASIWRHYQQLWYWVAHALLQVAVSTAQGRCLRIMPSVLGRLWGVACNLIPRGAGGKSALAKPAPPLLRTPDPK